MKMRNGSVEVVGDDKVRMGERKRRDNVDLVP